MNPIKNHTQEPLIRIAKRSGISRGQAWKIRFIFIFAALAAGGLLILALGHNPLAVYRDMVYGSLSNEMRIAATVRIMIPLLGAALAIAPAFKMKFWNIGGEGQIMAGAIAASYFALFHYQSMPAPALWVVMGLSAIIAGGIWGLIPAFFKSRWKTNETLFTLMLNYIILGVELYLQTGPWKNPVSTGFPRIAMFEQAARLPSVFGVHIGWILTAALVVLMYIYMHYTKQGYEIAVVGASEQTARYVGMDVAKVIMRTMFISGAIAGLVGFMLVAGTDYTLNSSTPRGIGFTAITVAWLAQLNPFGMVLISFFLAVLEKGGNTIQTNFKIPSSASEVLTGMILFFMLASEFFIQYRIIWRGRKEGK